MTRNQILALGLAAVLAETALWHGPLGAGDRLAGKIERAVRAELVEQEMHLVTARVERGPLRRRLLLSGPADDFQRSELVRIMRDIPGVSDASWSAGGWRMPLLAEAILSALVAFGLGLLLAYLVELRRRANAEWRW